MGLFAGLPANLACVQPDDFYSALLCHTDHPGRSAGNVILSLFEQRGHHRASRMLFARPLQLSLVISQPHVTGTRFESHG